MLLRDQRNKRPDLVFDGNRDDGGAVSTPRPLAKAFFPAMRFYDPDKPLFDRTWKLSDIERVSAQ